MSQYSEPSSAPPNSTLATISLISGIVSWLLLPFIGSIVAVITGHMAKKEIRASDGSIGGESFATIGLVLGYAQLALALIAICAITCISVLALSGSGINDVFNQIQSTLVAP